MLIYLAYQLFPFSSFGKSLRSDSRSSSKAKTQIRNEQNEKTQR